MPEEDQNPYRSEPSKVFDVVRPSQVRPDPNSRPVIPQPGPRVEDDSIGLRKPNPTMDNTTTPTQPDQIQPSEKQSKASGHKRWYIMLFLLLGITVLFVVADLLIDARVIHTTITPLTHFFHHS